MMTRAHNSRKGFTLVELLVAITLFSVAISIAVGGFVRALRTQRQVIGLISANSSASLALEQMAREMRTGFNFSCAGGGSTCSELTFSDADGQSVTYRLNSGTLEKGASGVFQTVTPANVNLANLSFKLLNDPNFPPRITISMSVSARSPDLAGLGTNLQTVVSARDF